MNVRKSLLLTGFNLAGIISSNLARNKDGKNTVVFNPTVPGKIVYYAILVISFALSTKMS
jgi:hypothetical protein